jgi:ABC-type glycerol-3-phosphate transport system permease component
VVDGRPGLTTVGLLVALAARGKYFGALILTGHNVETAPVAIYSYVGILSANRSLMAMAGFVVVPALLGAACVQPGFARGLTAGAVE